MQGELIKKADESGYPALYCSKLTGDIVLATQNHQGVLVVAVGSRMPIGTFTDSWTSFENKTIWERVPIGCKVVLTQTQQGE